MMDTPPSSAMPTPQSRADAGKADGLDEGRFGAGLAPVDESSSARDSAPKPRVSIAESSAKSSTRRAPRR